MKKILIINNFFSSFTGSDVVAFKEFQLLEKKGYEVFFYAVDRQPYFIKDYKYAKYFPTYKKFLNLSHFQKLITFLNPLNMLRPFYNFEVEKNLKRYIEDIKPDIIHCHSVYFHLSPSALKACYDKKIPVIMTLHASDLICPKADLMRNSEEFCKDAPCQQKNILPFFKNRCFKHGGLIEVLKTLIYFYYKISGLFDKADYYITPSEALRKLIIKKYLPANKVTTINNCIETSYLQPEYSNKNYFLFVGRLSKEKGVHYLLEAMSSLPQINLHIIGRGPNEDKLKTMAEHLNLKNVLFLGFKQGKDLEQEYKGSIATILPCNWFENFPTTINESFGYGKPVIASNIGGIPEMIDDNQNGLLFEPRNVEELTIAIKKLHDNPNLVIEMGKSARQKVEFKFNEENHCNKLINLYKEVLSNKASVNYEK